MRFIEAFRSIITKFADGVISTPSIAVGTQLADARAAQLRHEELHGMQRSILADCHYADPELRLWRWVESPMDRELEAKVALFAEANEAQRRSIRSGLEMDDFYTLFAFAKRCALGTLRTNEAHRIELAFSALAMVDLARIDWRDLLITIDLARYAGQQVGADVPELLGRAVKLAEPQTAKALIGRKHGHVSLERSCGYKLVTTPEGKVLFDNGFEPFSPTGDLIGIANKYALALEDNGYQVSGVQVATKIALIWLGTRDGSATAMKVGRTSGCVSIRGVPCFDKDPGTSGQGLLVFLAEAENFEDANEIALAAQSAANSSQSIVGQASGRLCAIVIQRSWLEDVPPLEDVASLTRLEGLFDQIIK